MDTITLRDLQIRIHECKELVNRETEDSPSCNVCSDYRFYFATMRLNSRIDRILDILEKELGAVPKKTFPWSRF